MQKDRYVQAIRPPCAHSHSHERTVQALDLEVPPASRIPTIAPAKPLPKFDFQGKSKIPAVRERVREEVWMKGDLLDSLDLSSTKVREKVAPFLGKMMEQADKVWLGKSIRESIQQWAPGKEATGPNIPLHPLISALSVPKETPIPANPPPPSIPTAKQSVPKTSKRVSELRGRVQSQRLAPDTGFLTEELHCIEAEEQHMLESLERLDLRLVSLPSDHQVQYQSKPRPRGLPLEQEAALVQESVSRLSDMLEKRSEMGSETGSVCSAPVVGVTRIKSKGYTERLLTKVTVEELKRERAHSSESGHKPPVPSISQKPDSASGYSRPKKLPIPCGRPPLPCKSRPEVLVNPHVDLRAVFEDDEQDLDWD